MIQKEKFQLEYVLRTSPKVLEQMLTTADGLSQWFADEVLIENDVYTFQWDSSEEEARLISKKNTEFIRWQWISDEEEGFETYFELKYMVDAMTKNVILLVTDFAEKGEEDAIKRLWEAQVLELRRHIGA